MAHNSLRKDQTCLNCGQTVPDRYCGSCGQENIEPRQTFGHLIGHFFEDLTHYDGKFWITLRYLFFKPAHLTKEYIAGKRNTYLQPVRLYIFASFITFLVLGAMPNPTSESHDGGTAMHNDSVPNRVDSIVKATVQQYKGTDTLKLASAVDSLAHDTSDLVLSGGGGGGLNLPCVFKNMKELDSAKVASATSNDPMGFIDYQYNKKVLALKKYSPERQMEMFRNSLGHNFPKALFLYMPLFAFILRLFHSRKNWIYFDHGIFTLHYFSFLLLSFLSFDVLTDLFDWAGYLVPSLKDILSTMDAIVGCVLGVWYPYYLFRAHQKMYGESAGVSAAKTSGILILNLALFVIVLGILAMVTIFTLH